jgi:hypothetical protein
MKKKKKAIPFCKIHGRPMVPTRFICPNCMGSITSPARRKAALNASKAAAAKRALVADKKIQRAKKGGRSKAEGDSEIF